MKLDDFDYVLPPEAIAPRPAQPRTAARLLDMRGKDFVDRHIGDLPSFLAPQDVLIINNTRVIPARLEGRRGDARISITLHQRTSADCWRCFAKPAKKLRLGDEVVFSQALIATVSNLGADGERSLTFSKQGKDLDALIEDIGTMPLPPYIPRPQGRSSPADADDYQTVYARHKGAVAAPTAGLHFTTELLEAIRNKGVSIAEITLHVGAGTFVPVKTENPQDHKMHKEWGEIDQNAADAINAAKAKGGKAVAVGTTSLRILESCWRDRGKIEPYQAETDLFILPGFRFGVVDMLLTNFHLPKSTLLMLVSAFAGKAKIDKAYAYALRSGYRFFSYGDACLMGCDDG